MTQLKILTLFAFSLGLITAQYAQNDSVYRFSLTEAQDFGIENYYQTKNAALDIEAAKKKVWETTAIGLPQVSGKIQGSYTPELTETVESFSSFGSLFDWMYGADQALYNLTSDPAFGNIPQPQAQEPVNPDDMKWSMNASLTVSQLLFSGSYIVGLQSAKVYKNISALNKIKTDQDVKEMIANSYYNVLIAEENKIILQQTYDNLGKTFAEMEAMQKQGLIEDTDVDQMELTVSNIKSSLDMITRLSDISINLLKTQLGININSKLELTDNLDMLTGNLSYESLLTKEFNTDNNVTIALLENSVEAQKLLNKLDKAAFLPDLAAFYMYYNEFNENAFSFNPPHTLGVTMNIPIFSSGQRLSKVSQSKIEYLKAENTLEQVSQAMIVDFQNSKSALIAASEKYDTEKKNLELSKRIYDKTLIKFNNGMTSSLDLTQVQNQYFTSQTNYYGSLQELISAKNKLEKLLADIR